MNRAWKQSLMTLPGVGVSILPKLACPACWASLCGNPNPPCTVLSGCLLSLRYGMRGRATHHLAKWQHAPAANEKKSNELNSEVPGEHHERKKENRSLQCGLLNMQRNHRTCEEDRRRFT